MPLDFSDEQEQQEFNNGPVPAGSIVVVEMEVLEPSSRDSAHPYISVAKTGLLQLYCQFNVIKGEYSGVSWRQNLTLPLKYQTARGLSAGQEKACHIGGAQFKAIQEASGARNINDWQDFSGKRFPVKVGINPRPSEDKNGNIYWKNQISMIITPDREQYLEVKRLGEIINPNGAVAGKDAERTSNGNGREDVDRYVDRFFDEQSARADMSMDEVPF